MTELLSSDGSLSRILSLPAEDAVKKGKPMVLQGNENENLVINGGIHLDNLD